MEITNNISIYSYSDPILFLNDFWNQKREVNNKYTVRAWSKKMGLKFHGPLYDILRGQRKIPKSYIPGFIKTLPLDSKESIYFETLVDINRAKKADEKEYFISRLSQLSPKKSIRFYELESFSSMKDPLHFALIEMTQLKGFKYDLNWIQNKLGVKRSISEIKQMIERLVSLGLLIEIDNSLQRTAQHIYSKQDVPDLALREYHKSLLKISSQAIDQQEISDREYNATCLNIKEDDIQSLKLELRSFMQEMISKYEAKPGDAKDTYQLNTQLFNLNKNINKVNFH